MDELSHSLEVARTNWTDWRNVYEHSGFPTSNPLLITPHLFAKFLHEYSVGRTIRGGKHDELRQTLIRLASSFDDDSGNGIDLLEEQLRSAFGSLRKGRTSPGRITSALSKVAAFLRPDRFVAYDSYAQKGLNRSLERASYHVFKNYQDYLAKIDEAWAADMGQMIRSYTIKNAHSEVEKQPRFQRRVLDVYLMTKGGREIAPAAADGYES